MAAAARSREKDLHRVQAAVRLPAMEAVSGQLSLPEEAGQAVRQEPAGLPAAARVLLVQDLQVLLPGPTMYPRPPIR